MKILNLILYNPNPHYNNMMRLTRYYLNKLKIEHYFYCYREDINEEYIFVGDMLYIKGKETYLPGILDKTIKAIEICQNKEYDYLVRTNISTVVDFIELSKIENIDYGGNIFTLMWLEPPCGIVDHTHYGAVYIHGICIILSRAAVNTLLKSEIDRTIIDDVAIGKALCKVYKPFQIKTQSADRYIRGTLIYRNKHANREADVIKMGKIMKDILVYYFEKKVNKNIKHTHKIYKHKMNTMRKLRYV